MNFTSSSLKQTLTSVAALYGLYKLVCLYRTDCDLKTKCRTVRKEYFRDKVVWITGASSGIGKQLAIELDALDVGVKLILSARRLAALESLNNALNCETVAVQCDLNDLASLEEVGRNALGAFGRVDFLFNNGGISTRSFAEDTDFSVDEKIMTVDFLSHVKLTKIVLPGMIQRKFGHIVNTSSLAGKLSSPVRTAYCAAKWAVLGHFDSLRLEVLRYNVHVTNVCPGSVSTDVAKNALVGDGSSYGKEDPNIANGMPVDRCAKLFLSATSNQLHEVWMFGSQREKIFTYLNEYFPETFRNLAIAGNAKMIREFEKQFREK